VGPPEFSPHPPLSPSGARDRRSLRTVIIFGLGLTNGRVSRELFWLSHRGADVYWGVGAGRLHAKYSYHGSGRRHMRTSYGEILREHGPIPNAIKGYEPIVVIGSLYDPSGYTSEQAAVFSGSKLDAVFMVDSRTLPNHGQRQVHIGMIEVGRFDVLTNLLRNGTLREIRNRFRILQSLLVTNCQPWILMWLLTIDLESGTL
jgi:hypothetical protein